MNFDASALTQLKVNLSGMFGPDTHDAHLNRDIPIFNSVFGDQQVNFSQPVASVLFDGKRCEQVEAWFLLTCDLSVQDCTTDCAIPEGNELETQSVFFEPSQCFEVIGKVTDLECRNGVTEEQLLAKEVARMLAALDQELEKRSIAQIISWSDDLTDVITDDVEIGGLDATSTIWEIPPEEWKSEMMIDLQCIVEDCDMISPKILTGKAWRKYLALSDAKDCGCAGKGCGNCHQYDSLLGSIPIASNTREFDQLLGNNGMLLIDNAKVGYFNTWIHTSTTPVPQNDGLNTNYYYLESPRASFNLNGTSTSVKYDFYWQRVCIAEDRWEIRLKGKHRGGYVCHPDGCEGVPNKKVIQIHKKQCSNC